MTTGIATTLVVFGRGLREQDGRFALTGPSAARALAAVRYVGAHTDAFRAAGPSAARIIFTGGWPGAAYGTGAPPPGEREADLMLRHALAHPVGAGNLADYARLRTETESRSTLENLLYVVRAGLLDGLEFSPAGPLGLVAHPAHLHRIRYLAGKVLGVTGDRLLDITAGGADTTRGAAREWAIYLATRAWLAGVHDPDALHRRERQMVRVLRRADAVRSMDLVRRPG